MQNNITAWSGKFELRDETFSHIFTNVVLRKLLMIITDKLNADPVANIGHIKGICTGHDKDYLKINFVSDSDGVVLSGVWNHKPKTTVLTLNVITMFIAPQDLKEIIHEAVRIIEGFCTVIIVPKPERSPFLVLT